MPKFPAPVHVQVFTDDSLYRAADPLLAQMAPESTLRFWRCRGGGPAFIKVTPGPRGRVFYLGFDLNKFIADRRVEVGNVPPTVEIRSAGIAG